MASLSLSSSNSAQASSSRSWKYDVFLSFRGEDTRKIFIGHLYSALVGGLISTYKDDEALPRGDSISPSLLKAIEESRIAVVVFSKNYADSSWCLDELAYIMKCRDEIGLIVMPIFYDVDPSQVRKQEGNFGEAFAIQESKNPTKVEKWRKALVDASNIAGWEPKHIANGHESEVIKEIVDKIQDRLFSLDSSDDDEELVGMRVRLQDLISRLEIGSGGVRMVGIWGIGGSGKTTLASSVYTEISHDFHGHCFIANIREKSKHGLETLQQKILSTLLKREVEVQNVQQGKRIIKSRLCNSKVLVILDDVDDLDQLEALAGSHKWFGVGSRIIITTRNAQLLQTHGVAVSSVKLLSDEEAILLFYKRAYNETEPLKDYEKLSSRVVSYAAGLPLALKVLGSFLFNKDKKEWISTLAKLEDIPNIEVMDILRISYDGLETLQKELFLVIACFFRGVSTDITHAPMEILDACGFHPVIGIKVLQERALISIVGGKFDMHDLVQEMGHYIVRGEHPNNPENHSRVWKEAEIDNMHLGNATKENHKIEAIDYYGHLSCFGMIFCNMKKLISYNDDAEDYGDKDGKYAEVPHFLSNEVRYFYSGRYPASPFRDSFQPLKLLVLKINESLQKELSKYKHLAHLKVLTCCMVNLLSTPDFDRLPYLQKLKLSFCFQFEIRPSLGNHRIENVSVLSCYKHRIFPTIVRMEKFNTLEISYCNNLIELPEIQANMERLAKLTLKRSIIKFLASSILERYTILETVFFRSTHIVQKLNFRGLRSLSLCGLHLKDRKMLPDVGDGLSNLVYFKLTGTIFDDYISASPI